MFRSHWAVDRSPCLAWLKETVETVVGTILSLCVETRLRNHCCFIPSPTSWNYNMCCKYSAHCLQSYLPYLIVEGNKWMGTPGYCVNMNFEETWMEFWGDMDGTSRRHGYPSCPNFLEAHVNAGSWESLFNLYTYIWRITSHPTLIQIWRTLFF